MSLWLNPMSDDVPGVAAAVIRSEPRSLSAFSVIGAVHSEPVNVLRENQASLLKGSYSKGTIPTSVILPPVTGARGPRPGPGPLQVGFTREIPASGAKFLDPAALFWSPVVSGETIGLEIYVPSPAGEAEVSFTIPRLSHLYAAPAAPQKRRGDASGRKLGEVSVNERRRTW